MEIERLLENTKASLAEDEKFLLELEKGCSSKTQEWEETKKTRAEELVALADTITALNDDDALELFKKTLPSAGASFAENSVRTANRRRSSVEKKDLLIKMREWIWILSFTWLWFRLTSFLKALELQS